MTLAQLALTVVLLGGLGLVVSRIGLSAIPAYLLAGLLLGPNEPKVLSLIHPSQVTDFVAELGIVFLLFFLGLEFALGRLLRTGRHLGLGGAIDLAANAGVGLIVGVAAFGFSFAALILAGAIVLGFAAGGGGKLGATLAVVAKALGFVTASLVASRWLARPIDRVLQA